MKSTAQVSDYSSLSSLLAHLSTLCQKWAVEITKCGLCVIHHASSVVKNLLYLGFSGIFIKNIFCCGFYKAIFHIQLIVICFPLYTGCIMGGLVASGEA